MSCKCQQKQRQRQRHKQTGQFGHHKVKSGGELREGVSDTNGRDCARAWPVDGVGTVKGWKRDALHVEYILKLRCVNHTSKLAGRHLEPFTTNFKFAP